MTLLDRMKSYCKEHGLTQREFCSFAQVNRGAFYNLAKGQCSPLTEGRIETALANQNPIKTIELKPLRDRLSPDDIANRRVHRDPCRKCGANGENGCAHQKPGTGRSIYA